jgi:hypothetical protein
MKNKQMKQQQKNFHQRKPEDKISSPGKWHSSFKKNEQKSFSKYTKKHTRGKNIS